MKYVSIDLETTGLYPESCQILEFAAVIEDTQSNVEVEKLPFFHTYIDNGDNLYGSIFAINMNKKIIEIINEQKKSKEQKVNLVTIDTLCAHFKTFLQKNGINPGERITAAGKNFATFDLLFLKSIDKWNVNFSNRVIDPAILYLNKNDKYLPDSQTCYNRANIKSLVSHCALDDARKVIELVRFKFGYAGF
jgi:oligoribonuclease